MILDVLIIIFILILLFKGLQKGFIYEVFSITKIFVTLFLVTKFNDKINNLLLSYGYKYSNVIVYIISFLIIYVILSIIVSIIDKFLKVIKLGTLNSLLGGLFGIIKGIALSFIVIVFLIFIRGYNEKIEKTLNTSYCVYYTSIYFDGIYDLFPKFMSSKLKEFSEKNKKIKLENIIYNKIKKDVLTDGVQ
ncbi:CvpA family protein [Caviibacter abscessus]|uniref:CvpA family protein n=1 Tax=Caviibacter abscessus TaxID=1766719 RepID=UPI0008333A17|nr:CvpA family protein [Caviibacter abscessus]